MSQQIRVSIPDDVYNLLVEACKGRDIRQAQIVTDALRNFLSPSLDYDQTKLDSILHLLNGVRAMMEDMIDKQESHADTADLGQETLGGYRDHYAAYWAVETPEDKATSEEVHGTDRGGAIRRVYAICRNGVSRLVFKGEACR